MLLLYVTQIITKQTASDNVKVKKSMSSTNKSDFIKSRSYLFLRQKSVQTVSI